MNSCFGIAHVAHTWSTVDLQLLHQKAVVSMSQSSCSCSAGLHVICGIPRGKFDAQRA
jgi:hypothetical protein